MPNVRGEIVDGLVWEWAKMIIQSPENLRVGLDGVQQELEEQNRSLIERLQIIEEQISSHQSQLDRLLDLYLDGNFPKEVLTERKARLEELLFNLGKEQQELMVHVRQVTMTDDQLAYIEAFCAKIKTWLENADLKTRRQIIDLLDIRDKVAFENNEKIIYLRCLINIQEQQPVLRIPISPSSNRQPQYSIELTARMILDQKT